MKASWNWLFAMAVAILLVGCTVGNGRICGPQTPSANCNKEMLDALLHPPKDITFWNQPGVSEDQKMRDWLACGGRRDGGVGYDVSKPLPGETQNATWTRLENEFYRCLIRKGYRYRSCELGKRLDEVICESPPKR